MPSSSLRCRTLFFARNLPSNVRRAFLLTNLRSGNLHPPPLFRKKRMAHDRQAHRRPNQSDGESGNAIRIDSNPIIDKMQQLVHSDSSNGWDKCWEEGAMPWDLGQVTPVLLHLHRTGALPKGRALVPGCGSGHDVVAIACPERYVVGLDLSGNAVRKAMELYGSSPNCDYLAFLTADFFTWQPEDLFDIIFDHTFFCAIDPSMRRRWASRIPELLKPDGELITLMFPISEHTGGPPYKVSVADYEEALHPVGFKAISIVKNELAVGPRKGREKIGWWKRSAVQSLL